MSVTLNGNEYSNEDFAGMGYVEKFPEPIFTDLLAHLAGYISAGDGFSNGERINLTHGLTLPPTRFGAYLVCIIATGGYAIGDRINIDGPRVNSSDETGVQVSCSATVLTLTIGANGIVIYHKDTGVAMAATDTNFTIVGYAS